MFAFTLPDRTRCRTAIAIATSILSAVSLPAAGQSPPPASFRGLYVDAYHEGFKSAAQIDALVSHASTRYYNAIVAEVLAYHDNAGVGHGAYWNSAIVPKASDVSASFDPLAYLVQRAHAAGLEVHAWLVPYRVSTTWPPSGNGTLEDHPQWLMTTLAGMGGGPSKIGTDFMLDPGSPDVQNYLIGIVRELVTHYAIDGIHWDRLHYAQTDAGYPGSITYADSGLARFCRMTYGPDPCVTPPPTGSQAWDDFRRRVITELVRRACAEIHSNTTSTRQPLRHSAALLGGACPASPPSRFEDTQAYKLFQDWRTWMAKGYLDAGVPLVLDRLVQPTCFRAWVTKLLEWRYGGHMFIGLSIDPNNPSDICRQITDALACGADGVCVAAYVVTPPMPPFPPPGVPACFTAAAPLPTMAWWGPTTANNGMVWGRVTERCPRRPVDNAVVQVGALPAVQTDGSGYYVVTQVPASASGTEYSVVAGEPGCAPEDVVVQVAAGQVASANIPLCAPQLLVGDFDVDCDVDLMDFASFQGCFNGPNRSPRPDCGGYGDFDGDMDVDLVDFSVFQTHFTGPNGL